MHLSTKEILAEVEHVKAHRTEKDKKEVSHFEKLVTDGNEKADERAKAGAMRDEGFMTKVRAKNGPAGKRRSVCSPALCSSGGGRERLSRTQVGAKRKWTLVDKKREKTRHRTERCPNVSMYRCLRCGRGSKYKKMQRKCTGPKYLSKNLGKWEKATYGRTKKKHILFPAWQNK